MTKRRRWAWRGVLSTGAAAAQRTAVRQPSSTPRGAPQPEDLRMLASAIAGRAIAVAASSDNVAHTDGSTIFVQADDAATTVCVQAAMIAAGSLHVPSLRRALTRRGAIARYVTLEAARAVAVLDHLLPSNVTAAVREHWTEPVTVSPWDSALKATGRGAVPDAPAAFGILRRAALSAPPVAGVAEAEGTDLDGDLDADEPHDDPEGKAQKSALLMPALFDNAFTRMMKEILGSEGTSDSDEDDSGGTETAVKSAVRRSRPSATAKPIAARLAARRAAAADPSGSAYPEWDFRSGAYRAGWCSVVTLDPAPRPDTDALRVPINRELLHAAIRVTVAREPHNRQRLGDALDLAALVDFEVSRRTGETPDDRVMQARLRTASDLSVLVLLDCSGSGAETSAGHSIWEHQRTVAAQLLAAFDTAGARVACYGFSSRARTVQFLRVKGFEGRCGRSARTRLAMLQPSGYTRMGAAIRHATHVLSTAGGTDRRLLVVISDGLPYDDDYEGAYAENDASHALEEATARGVGCACFTVESPTGALTLERMWGSATYVQLGSDQRWTKPVEETLQVAMRRAASTARSRPGQAQGAVP